MAEIDRRAQEEYNIPQIVLMENAGRSVAEIILSEIKSIENERIAVLCGNGNNGGDGFVIASHLAERSPSRLTIYAPRPEKIKKGAAFENFGIMQKMGLEILPVEELISSPDILAEYTVSIDSIFGTGFKGDLPEGYGFIGKVLNGSGLKRYAVDIPSGLDSTTGRAAENCLKADKTITFGLPKRGFFIGDGPGVCGKIVVRNVGFPESLLREYM